MIYLLIAISAMSLIMLALKFFNIKGIYIPQVIIVNYAFALCISLMSGHEVITPHKIAEVFTNGWWYLALIAGSLYFASMDLMAISTRRVGVAVTTMASRTSVLLPIIWAFLFLGEDITVWEILGTALVLAAFALIIYRPPTKAHKVVADRKAKRQETIISVLIPIGVFLEVGFIANGWWYIALIFASLCFASMDLMVISTRRIGVAVPTIASRTSVLLPIIFTFMFLGEDITVWEILGTALVLAAFALIIYRPPTKAHKVVADRKAKRQETIFSVLMPIGVFLEVGFIAICMKTSQHMIKTSGTYTQDYPAFEALLFAAALSCAVIYYSIKEKAKVFRFNLKSVVGGLCLGTFNYFVTFGLMNGLKYFSSSTFYGVYNISVVVLTAIVGVLLFSEKLDSRKIAGIVLAVAAIVVLGFFGQNL